MRDDVVWPLVFYHPRARDDREQPAWAKRLPKEPRTKLSEQIEAKALEFRTEPEVSCARERSARIVKAQ